MAEWQSGDVVANGIKIHYYRTGGDKPPVVLSHGFSDDGLCWTRVTRALEADYDVIMPDARGHGLSDAPDGGYDASTRAADLAGLIQALGLDRPAIGGHSMGGQTTLYCAALYPDLVRAAVLEDPGLWMPGSGPSAEERTARSARMREETEKMRSMTRDQLIAHLREIRPTWDEVEHGPWADSKMRMSQEGAGRLRAQDPMTWQEAMARIKCPTLLIMAEPEKDAIVTLEAEAEAKRIMPSLRTVRLGGAGHNIRREAFEPFVEAVRAFLGEVYAGA